MENIEMKLRAYFRSIGKTQVEIAEELGCSPSYVGQMINGKIPFGKKSAIKWSKKYGFSVEWLMSGGEGEMFTDKSPSAHHIDIITDGSAKAGRDVNVQGPAEMLDIVRESQRQSAEVLRQTAQMQEIMKAMMDKIK